MNLFPLAKNSKVPLPGHGSFSLITDDEEIHKKWLQDGFNLGMPLRENHRVVADFDGLNHENGIVYAREFYQRYKEIFGEPPHVIVRTPSNGIHFHFEGISKTRAILDQNGNKIGDVKASGYVLWIRSQVKGNVYRLIQDGALQPFPEELFPRKEVDEKVDVEKTRVVNERDPVRRIVRARAWMKHREGKEDGNGRGLQMIKTCRALFRMFELTEEQVWPLILEYNERCIPPYTLDQLKHKITDSQKG